MANKIEAVLNAPVEKKRQAIEEVKAESMKEILEQQEKQRVAAQAIDLERNIIAAERDAAERKQREKVEAALKERLAPGWLAFPIFNRTNVGYLCKDGIILEPVDELKRGSTIVSIGNGLSRTITGVTPRELYDLFTKGGK